MPKFIVKSPLDHDGKAFAEGDPIELSKKLAAPLLAAGVVAPEGAEPPAADSAPAAPDA